jgi:dipeptidyl aminopeptidase/acylaminoacyl peptidase
MVKIKHTLVAAMIAAVAFRSVATDAHQTVRSVSTTTVYHTVTVDGLTIFYREAGPKDAPIILLLHGYPSSRRTALN